MSRPDPTTLETQSSNLSLDFKKKAFQLSIFFLNFIKLGLVAIHNFWLEPLHNNGLENRTKDFLLRSRVAMPSELVLVVTFQLSILDAHYTEEEQEMNYSST